MPTIIDQRQRTYSLIRLNSEAKFEEIVLELSAQIFGTASIYIPIKRRVGRENLVTIPDGYVVDMADPASPKLYVVENEIVSHDPFKHIGIQMLKYGLRRTVERGGLRGRPPRRRGPHGPRQRKLDGFRVADRHGHRRQIGVGRQGVGENPLRQPRLPGFGRKRGPRPARDVHEAIPLGNRHGRQLQRHRKALRPGRDGPQQKRDSAHPSHNREVRSHGTPGIRFR